MSYKYSEYVFVGGDNNDINYSIFKNYFKESNIPKHSGICGICKRTNIVYNYYITTSDIDISNIVVICKRCKNHYNTANIFDVSKCILCGLSVYEYEKSFISNNICIICESYYYLLDGTIKGKCISCDKDHNNIECNLCMQCININKYCLLCNCKIDNSEYISNYCLCNNCGYDVTDRFNCYKCNALTFNETKQCNVCFEKSLSTPKVATLVKWYNNKDKNIIQKYNKFFVSSKNLNKCECGNDKPMNYIKCYSCYIDGSNIPK